MINKLIHGDCIKVMRSLPDSSVDSIVTDPPYGLGFMGKAWDALPPGLEWAEECLRVLKPGGHLLAFGGTRTWHRLAVAVEDAGFEIRDSIAWLYGSGFPKSMDVSKAIDKMGGDHRGFHKFAEAYASAVAASGKTHTDIDNALGIKSSSCYWVRTDHRGGLPPRHHWEQVRDMLGLSADLEALYDEAEREVLGVKKRAMAGWNMDGSTKFVDRDITAPATPAAQQWEGWGTALKPAFEPVVVGRKPFPGTVAANVLEYGTGALNIDGCRVNPGEPVPGGGNGKANHGGKFGGSADYQGARPKVESHNAGRWPANVMLDEDAAAVLDEQAPSAGASGKASGKSLTGVSTSVALGQFNGVEDTPFYGDSGGASRFFYVAKAPKRERPVVDGVAHATVKPLELMRQLVRLVTPPRGVVLEPFAGSGTTVEACMMEGFRYIAIEREADYLPLIQARIERATTALMEDLL